MPSTSPAQPPQTAALTSSLEPFGLALERSRASAQDCQTTVRPSLTATEPPARRRRKARDRRPLEATDFAAMMRRMLAAHGRRVADADVEDLADLMALQADLDAAIAYAVTESRARHGRSWADIGRAAGVEKQTAHERWSKR